MALISGSFHLAFFLPGVIFHSGESQGLFPYGFSAFYSNICSLKPFFLEALMFLLFYIQYIYIFSMPLLNMCNLSCHFTEAILDLSI